MGSGFTKGAHSGKRRASSRAHDESKNKMKHATTARTTVAVEAISMDEDDCPIPIKDDKLRERAQTVTMEDVLGPADSETARYRKRQTIGRGAFGDAFIVEFNPHCSPLPGLNVNGSQGEPTKNINVKSEQKLFVAKVMHLTSMSPNDRKYAQTEIMCLACNHHFAIIQYHEHFFIDDDQQTLVIITEFADGGDLYRNLYKGDCNWCLTEKEAGIQFVQLILGLDHIHRRRMIHRDIKTANIFLTSNGFLKLGDFGFSQQYDCTVSNPIARTFLGTSYYVAPEMWKGQRYGKKADIWAAGVVLCELLGRRRPFEADSLPEMEEKILSKDMWLPPVYPSGHTHNSSSSSTGDASLQGYISREMQEFLLLLLQHDPEQRPSAGQLLKTPLMQHYLFLFEKRLETMASLDAALEKEFAANPEAFARAPPSYRLTADVRSLVLQGIGDGKAAIAAEAERERAESRAPCLEGTVYKESGRGQWKERYLILADGFLTMTLTKGKVAAASGERSKRVPIETLTSAVPVLLDAAQVIDGSHSVEALHGFAISTRNSQSIVFATSTEQERDDWLTALIVSLKLD